jgi:hypothetical protein
MVEVTDSYDDRKERARKHKIVHALSSWVSDASDPGDMSERLTAAKALRNQAADLMRRANFSEGYKRLGTLENFVRYEAKQVDKWESDLDFGAGRWVVALTALKDGLSILATGGASALVAEGVAAGGSLIGATATVGAATTAAGAGGAIAGDLAAGETDASKIWSDARTGAGAGAVVGLSGGAGSIANEAFGVGRAAGFASKAARSVGASVTSGTAVNLTAATLAGKSKKDAVVGGLVGGVVSGLGGTAVGRLAGDNAWAKAAGNLVVGGASGVASSAATGANIVEGGLTGAALSGYSHLVTPTVPAGASPTSGLEPVAPAAHPQVDLPEPLAALQQRSGVVVTSADVEGGVGWKLVNVSAGDEFEAFGLEGKTSFKWVARVPEENWAWARRGNQLVPEWYTSREGLAEVMVRYRIKINQDVTAAMSKVADQEQALERFGPAKFQYFLPEGFERFATIERIESVAVLIPGPGPKP